MMPLQLQSEVKNGYSSYLSDDKKFLKMDYLNFNNSNDYDDYLDEANSKFGIYETVEVIHLITDWINELPRSFRCFTNLVSMDVDGSRFWNLRANQFPSCIQILIVVSQSNLSSDFFEGCSEDEFPNLKELHLDGVVWFPYNKQNDSTPPIPEFKTLEKVFLHFDDLSFEDYNSDGERPSPEDHKKFIIQSALCSQLKIKKIEVDNEGYICNIQ